MPDVIIIHSYMNALIRSAVYQLVSPFAAYLRGKSFSKMYIRKIYQELHSVRTTKGVIFKMLDV